MARLSEIQSKQFDRAYLSKPFYYFGYGPESTPELIQLLIDRELNYEPAVALNRQLAIQQLDQTPDRPVKVLGGRSVQEVLRDTWGSDFSAYTLIPGQHRGDTVKGTVFEIVGLQEARAIMAWDHAGPDYGDSAWRYWDRSLELASGDQVMTLSTPASQEVHRVVDGQKYPPILGNPEDFARVLENYLRTHQEL